MSNKNDLYKPIHKDFRGEIRRFDIGGAKFNVLSSKSGTFRGGDYHPVTQYGLVLKGKFEITLRKGEKDEVVKKGPNELIVIPPNIPHLYKSLTDSVFIEWWDGPFEAEYYEPYRKFMKQQFAHHNR
jgi:dTDP-4-dehydrorhamnose 3,5-epimerase-like enzyme